MSGEDAKRIPSQISFQRMYKGRERKNKEKSPDICGTVKGITGNRTSMDMTDRECLYVKRIRFLEAGGIKVTDIETIAGGAGRRIRPDQRRTEAAGCGNLFRTGMKA